MLEFLNIYRRIYRLLVWLRFPNFIIVLIICLYGALNQEVENLDFLALIAKNCFVLFLCGFIFPPLFNIQSDRVFIGYYEILYSNLESVDLCIYDRRLHLVIKYYKNNSSLKPSEVCWGMWGSRSLECVDLINSLIQFKLENNRDIYISPLILDNLNDISRLSEGLVKKDKVVIEELENIGLTIKKDKLSFQIFSWLVTIFVNLLIFGLLFAILYHTMLKGLFEVGF